MAPRQYHYVGPADIRERALASSSAGTPIRSASDLSTWIASNSSDAEVDDSLIATFTVGIVGILLLAPRRSEHVACAGGGPVVSAGEITFSSDQNVSAITNQSTGFCPEPESWPVVAAALDAIPIRRPDNFTTQVVSAYVLPATSATSSRMVGSSVIYAVQISQRTGIFVERCLGPEFELFFGSPDEVDGEARPF